MSFLQNDGDIIIDCILTDEGRRRLAQGDGTFKVVKFALGDDEINYALYNSSHTSGSSYFDLSILQTPTLEAISDNASAQKYKLISIPRTNILYLPTMALNDVWSNDVAKHSSGLFIVAVDQDTEEEFTVDSSNQQVKGVIQGENSSEGVYIRVDQGLNTTEISPKYALDSDLIESEYEIQINNKYGVIVSEKDGRVANVSRIDDDNIAYYKFSLGVDPEFVNVNTDRTTTSTKQIISGPRGTYLKFRIGSSLDLNGSTYLFTANGNTTSMTGKSGSQTIYYIDTYVKIKGLTTGMSLDIPVRFIKL